MQWQAYTGRGLQEAMVLLTRLLQALQAAADPRKAPTMQAYMKSSMPYHGVPAPLLRQVCRQAFLRFSTRAQWQKTALDLWRPARFS